VVRDEPGADRPQVHALADLLDAGAERLEVRAVVGEVILRLGQRPGVRLAPRALHDRADRRDVGPVDDHQVVGGLAEAPHRRRLLRLVDRLEQAPGHRLPARGDQLQPGLHLIALPLQGRLCLGGRIRCRLAGRARLLSPLHRRAARARAISAGKMMRHRFAALDRGAHRVGLDLERIAGAAVEPALGLDAVLLLHDVGDLVRDEPWPGVGRHDHVIAGGVRLGADVGRGVERLRVAVGLDAGQIAPERRLEALSMRQLTAAAEPLRARDLAGRDAAAATPSARRDGARGQRPVARLVRRPAWLRLRPVIRFRCRRGPFAHPVVHATPLQPRPG
jgi:hypothetical protein